MMTSFSFLCFCFTTGLTVSSSLKLLQQLMDCGQPGLEHCKINNCSAMVADRDQAPTGPDWATQHVMVGLDRHGRVPVLNVTWLIKVDATIWRLRGSQINVTEGTTNQTLCVQFSFSTKRVLNPAGNRWTFSLDEVVVEPGHEYTVTVFNLPEPHIGHYRIRKLITIPGCDDKRIQSAQMCLENGSLWEPNVSAAVFSDKKSQMLCVVVGFKTSKYSERYQVSILDNGFHYTRNVSKEKRTSLNVTFEWKIWQLSQCNLFIKVKPFFRRCRNNCLSTSTTINYCLYLPSRTPFIKITMALLFIGGCLSYLLWRAYHKGSLDTSSLAAKEEPDSFQIQQRKCVLIIYSNDHPLYKHIVLKLSAFLAAKCGTEVVLDLLDSVRLGMLGSIPWLEWRREQMKNSSNKILILCSPGLQAKWRAMCGGKPVFLREDVSSPMGDMLTPSLSLMVPDFIRSASYKKYIVAYFDDVCSEEDIPSPFSIAVRYKLMKQFEEVFFRILDTEKHEPGKVKQVEGLSEEKYHQCPSGSALRDAIEAFQAYQLEHPLWFEDELLESSEMEVKEASPQSCEYNKKLSDPLTCSEQESVQISSHVEAQECGLTEVNTKFSVVKTLQICPSVGFNTVCFHDRQPVYETQDFETLSAAGS